MYHTRPQDPRACLINKGISSMVHWHEVVTSTNEVALEHGQYGAWHAAFAQSKGQGRRDHSWVSVPGGLYLSGLMDLQSAPHPLLGLMVAAAVRDVLQAKTRRLLKIKWPNDLVIVDEAQDAAPGAGADPRAPEAPYVRKLGGILLKSSALAPVISPSVAPAHTASAGGNHASVLIGIGINVWPYIIADMPQSFKASAHTIEPGFLLTDKSSGEVRDIQDTQGAHGSSSAHDTPSALSDIKRAFIMSLGDQVAQAVTQLCEDYRAAQASQISEATFVLRQHAVFTQHHLLWINEPVRALADHVFCESHRALNKNRDLSWYAKQPLDRVYEYLAQHGAIDGLFVGVDLDGRARLDTELFGEVILDSSVVSLRRLV